MDCYTGFETPQAANCYTGYEVPASVVVDTAVPEPAPTKEPRIDLKTLIERDWNAEFQVCVSVFR